jgi:hypothetical protein
MIRTSLNAVSFPFVGLLIFGLSSAHATEQLYKRECNGCHSEREGITCNGCHVHGTHASLGEIGALNLVAKTDRDSYAIGDDIAVTLEGGHRSGWVGVTLYDEKGVSLIHARTELPATITTRAHEGMTKIYVAWLGYEFDLPGAKYGAPISEAIGLGMRESFRAGVHEDQPHVEEIVATNDFVVGSAPVSTTVSTTVDSGAAEAGDGETGGGGALDFLWILGGFLVLAFLRRRDRWRKKSISADTGRNKTSNAAPV